MHRPPPEPGRGALTASSLFIFVTWLILSPVPLEAARVQCPGSLWERHAPRRGATLIRAGIPSGRDSTPSMQVPPVRVPDKLVDPVVVAITA